MMLQLLESKKTVALVAIAASMVAGCWTLHAQNQQPAAAGPFTAAQVAQGRTAFAQNCATCHGANLQGGGEAPTLSGTGFVASWSQRTTNDLLSTVQLTMPQMAPNSLSPETYASIIAFLLRANGAEPGPSPLTASTSVAIGSIATGNMPSGFSTTAPAPAAAEPGGAVAGRGGRGGRGGAARQRTGLTVTGTVKNYTPVTDAMLLHPPESDWLMHYNNYSGWSHSTLSQITDKNVGNLQLVWAWPLDEGARQQITPLVHDGVMFLSTNYTNVVQALDAATGDLIWENRIGPTGTEGQNATRTMALYGNLLFYPATDAKLYGLDARTGKVVWETQVSDYDGDKIGGIMVVHGKVIAGLTRCDDRNLKDRCFIAAYDANTGKLDWKLYTVAYQGETGGDSWGNLPNDKRAGADPWIAGVYDPQLNLVYWGTGQAKPSSRSARGTDGDALFSNSTLAFNPDTGKMAWYFQHTPGESLDLDTVFERVLINHGTQKTVMTVGKDGLLWKLDRTNGKFLDVTETVFQNVWASIDMKTGRPTYRADILEQKPGDVIAGCPSPEGGHNWPATSYVPQDDILLIPLSQTCAMQGRGQEFYEMPGTNGNLGRLSAYETKTMKPLWTFQQRSPFLTSVMSTDGNVAFVGDFDRVFRAFNIKTGQTLWQTRLPTTAQGYPTTFSVNGRQYIAVPTGYNGGSPEQKPTTMIGPELNRPMLGHGVYVFALPQTGQQELTSKR